MASAPLHASTSPTAAPTADVTTGEIRVPLELWSVDQPQGPAELVLSAVEAEHLHAHLSRLMRNATVARSSSARVANYA